MKKAMLFLFICGLGSIVAIIGLYIISGMLIHGKNGFIRLLPSHFITESKRLDINYNSYYIAGVSDSGIYLGNYTAPNKALKINYNLADRQMITLPGPIGKRFAWTSMKVFVDSSGIYMMEGVSPIIVHLQFRNDTISEHHSFKSFNESIPMSPGSFIMNRFDATLNQDILVKVTDNGSASRPASYILPKQMDGIFSVDGMIHWDRQFKKIIYLFYYRNEFICLDSNLRTIYTGNTIDTFRHAHIKLTPISKEGLVTFAAPPQITNEKSCVDGSWLYVLSALVANNENPDYFKNNSVIDIYNIQNGRYRYSFYLPNLYHTKARDFSVCGNRLFALYDHYLVSFQMFP